MAPMRFTRTFEDLMVITPEWVLGAYVAFGLAALGLRKIPAGAVKDGLFAGISLAAAFIVHFAARDPRAAMIFCVYLGLVLGIYPLMRFCAARTTCFWLAFSSPILLLAAVRYLPTDWLAPFSPELQKVLKRNPEFSLAPYFLGLSYLAFRCSRMWIDVRNGAPCPTLLQFAGFAFFFPVMSVGPIHRWQDHREALKNPVPFPIFVCVQRIFIGLAKAVFLAGLVGQLGYQGIFFDGHKHTPVDLGIAAIAYYLYLYLNFSGYCDLAIGLAGLAGIPVPEDFRSPLLARNLKEFWNRWHITLSEWMRDLLFSPMAKFLVARVGPQVGPHAVAACIMVVFLLIGIWHGRGWTFLFYGPLQGLGVTANHYSTLALKKYLSRDQYLAYMANRWVEGTGIMLTFLYVAATLFFMANSPAQIQHILHVLR